jgi:hypothetical protein
MKRISKAPLIILLLSVSTTGYSEDPPEWWDVYGVTGSATESNNSPAVLGQLKWMASCAWTELDIVLPGGAGFALSSVVPPIPGSPDQAWYDAQKAVANLGQLKNVAEPFYRRLHVVAPGWVAEEFDRNGLASWPFFVPWNPSTPVGENFSPAVLGQLKMVFSLRFKEDADSDTLPDLLEHFLYGSTAGDGTTTDYDKDGLTDFAEISGNTRPDIADTDGDGIPDGIDDLPLSPVETDPLEAETLHVWAPGN